jgi:predicted nucleotidyltransferase
MATCQAAQAVVPVDRNSFLRQSDRRAPKKNRCYIDLMDRQTIIARLREHEADLRARGVMHAALFGSRARGDNRPDSDTDILIEIDPDSDLSIWGYVGLKQFVASLFDGPVDVVDREALKPCVAPAATTDAVYAF